MNAKGKTEISKVAIYFDRPISEAAKLLGTQRNWLDSTCLLIQRSTTFLRDLSNCLEKNLSKERPEEMAEQTHSCVRQADRGTSGSD